MVEWRHRLNGPEFDQTPGDTMKDRETWHTAVHGVAKSQTGLSDWISTTSYQKHRSHTKTHLTFLAFRDSSSLIFTSLNYIY